MARSFRRKEPMAAVTEINVTPLIDLAFSLLIIFMITTPLLEQSIEIELPIQDMDTPAEPSDEPMRVIEISSKGEVFWEGEKVNTQRLDQLLQSVALEPEQPIISVRGDKNVKYQHVISVIDIVKKYNLTKLSLETQVQ